VHVFIHCQNWAALRFFDQPGHQGVQRLLPRLLEGQGQGRIAARRQWHRKQGRQQWDDLCQRQARSPQRPF
jgi:hypothetical protein